MADGLNGAGDPTEGDRTRLVEDQACMIKQLVECMPGKERVATSKVLLTVPHFASYRDVAKGTLAVSHMHRFV